MLLSYLDAGSGSLILQAILGGAAGVAVAFKAWRARISGKAILANVEVLEGDEEPDASRG